MFKPFIISGRGTWLRAFYQNCIVPSRGWQKSIRPTQFLVSMCSLLFYRGGKGTFWESKSGLRGEVKWKALIWFLPASFRCTGQLVSASQGGAMCHGGKDETRLRFAKFCTFGFLHVTKWNSKQDIFSPNQHFLLQTEEKNMNLIGSLPCFSLILVSFAVLPCTSQVSRILKN